METVGRKWEGDLFMFEPIHKNGNRKGQITSECYIFRDGARIGDKEIMGKGIHVQISDPIMAHPAKKQLTRAGWWTFR